MNHKTYARLNTLPDVLNAFAATMGRDIENVESSRYPPQNIFRRGENDIYIEMSISGFTPEEVDISVERRMLTVSGAKAEGFEAEDDRVFLHRGLAQRDFKRSYQISQHVSVASAEVDNGILTIHLVREVPEAEKPKKIEITSNTKIIN